MDPAMGQNISNVLIYALLVCISTFSTYLIGTLLLPYICNEKIKDLVQRPGY